MPDPLLGDEQLIGEWEADARLFIVTGWVAGPAGSVGVELSGTELDIDLAAPTRTCQLLVPAAPAGDPAAVPDATRAVLYRLLGDPRAVALLNLSRGHRGRPVALAPTPGAGVDARLARLGLARLSANDDALPPAARAVARLEAGMAAADLPADLGLAPAVAADTAAGTGALLGLATDGDLGWLDPISAFRLAALVRRVAGLPGTDPETAEALGRLAAGLDLDPAAGLPPATPAPAPTLTAAGPAREAFGLPAAAQGATTAGAPLRHVGDEVDARELSPAPELDAASAQILPPGARVEVARPSRHEIEVTLPGLAGAVEGVWARVLRRSDGLLLALAPFRPTGPGGADARARLLVPPEGSAELVVDLSADPAAPAPSAALVAFESALAAGRWAARAQRLGQRGTAIAAWRECAQAWTAAGDGRRAAMATEYAELVLTQAVPPPAEPLVSDRLA